MTKSQVEKSASIYINTAKTSTTLAETQPATQVTRTGSTN